MSQGIIALDVGGVGRVYTDCISTIRWSISRFMERSRMVKTILESPYFYFRGVEKCLIIVRLMALNEDQPTFASLNASTRNRSWMGIECVFRELPWGSTLHACIVDREDRQILHTGTEKDGDSYTQPKWIPRTELESRMEEVLHEGQLRILCRLVLPGEREHYAMDAVSGLETLARNFKDMFAEGKDCDFVVSVKGRKFPTHRCILRARIKVFEAMLTHDTLENREGVLSIEDCDPEVFYEFLLFLYSGRVENLSPDNVCGLYVLADKYDLQELKYISLDSMKSALSIDNFCDVICLAAMHREAELLKLASQFFAKNIWQIVKTDKWKQFCKENTELGRELYLEKLDRGKEKIFGMPLDL